MMKKSFLATVEFVSPHKHSELAARLARAIGVALLFDESGKYDEVPAFFAKVGGLDLSLLGAPEGHPTHESVLAVRMRTELPFAKLHSSIPSFFREVLVDKGVNAKGFIDCSSELAQALVQRGFADCSPVSSEHGNRGGTMPRSAPDHTMNGLPLRR
jgi:hypothetical protein